MKHFKSGAKRAQLAPRYDLIPAAGMRRLAERCGLGAAKYGEWNWHKGLRDKNFVKQMKCHLVEHTFEYFRHGNKNDDNLAAIAWNAMALMEAERANSNAKARRNRAGNSDSKVKARGKVPDRALTGLRAASRGVRGGR